MKVIRYLPFGVSHATLSEKIFSRENGQIVIKTINSTSDKAGSLLKAFPASLKTTADGACATDETAVPSTLTTINGHTVTAGDYVIICAQGGMFMDLVAGIVAGVSITLTSNAVYAVASGDEIFVVKAADIQSIDSGAASLSLEYPICGNQQMPLALRLDSTSAGNFGGVAEVVA